MPMQAGLTALDVARAHGHGNVCHELEPFIQSAVQSVPGGGPAEQAEEPVADGGPTEHAEEPVADGDPTEHAEETVAGRGPAEHAEEPPQQGRRASVQVSDSS